MFQNGRGGDVILFVTNIGPNIDMTNGSIIGPDLDENGVATAWVGTTEESTFFWEPVKLKAKAGTKIWGYSNVEIYTDEGGSIDLTALEEGAISAKFIRIQTKSLDGKGGTLDLRGLNSKIFKATRKVEIYADDIQTDIGVDVRNLIDAPEISINSGRIAYFVNITGKSLVTGEPDSTINVPLRINNIGVKYDTYRLEATSSQGWNLGTLPNVTLDSGEVKTLNLSVTLPSQRGLIDTIKVVATSQSNSSIKNELKLSVKVNAGIDSDGDSYPDSLDSFPTNSEEWLDSDTDGIGNNSDTDNDNDGMPDVWENKYNSLLIPVSNDANEDADNDGFLNLAEYIADTDPTDPNSKPEVIEDVVDVWVSDPKPDDGTEPGKASRIWVSPDVWVRNADDNGVRYQNVKYGQDNYVYVNIRNRGTLPAQNTKVEVYRSGASMGQSWPRGWALVGTADVTSLEPEKSEIVHIKWEKDNVPKPGHYCFYVRLLNDEDPMFSQETGNMVQNTKTNNNIAWRNFNIVGLLTKIKDKFEVEIGNPTDTDVVVEVVFDEQENLLANDGAKAIVDLGETLFQRWQQAGSEGENLKILEGTEVQLLAIPAKFKGITLKVGESLPITMRVEATKPMPGAGTSREYHFSAQEFINGELVGGVDYAIVTRAQDTDSDGDGIKDVEDNDNDNDGIPDDWEIEHDMNPLGDEDADDDLDGDGFTNKEEYEAGTDPEDSDSQPNVPPTARLSASPNSGQTPLIVALDGSTSTDTDGNIVNYTWTASDGQTAEGQNVSMTFDEAGDYTITIEVTDDKGATNSATTGTITAIAKPQGDYTTYGTIRDDLGNKLAGVEIQVAGQTVTTDAAGNWEISNLQEGEYTVTVTKDGYTFAPEKVALGNEHRQEAVLIPLSKLAVKVVAEPRVAKQDSNVTYIATVINGGDETATGVVLTNVLPANAAGLVSIEALDGGECNANTVTCTLPDLTIGNSARVKLVVSNTQANNLLNTVTVQANEYPADVQQKWTQVIPHLSTSITDSPDPLQLPILGEQRVLHYEVAATLSANAPSAATGVKLVMMLPKNVNLQAVNANNSMCDSSQASTITCQLTDLSVASADSISHVTVGVDVVLNDAGLLTLMLEAKVSANEYPVHTDKERTKIFIDPNYKVGLVLVIDDTGSMQGEINQVKAALNKVIDAIDPSQAPLSVLLSFGDEVKYHAVTQDMTVLRDAVAKLKASGGGTCPEASFEAISFAIPHVKEGGTIIFATDASPYEGSDVDGMIARLRSNGIVFNAMVFGDCSNQESWNQAVNAE